MYLKFPMHLFKLVRKTFDWYSSQALSYLMNVEDY